VWTLGYLFHRVLTRDPWMHRVDICRAAGRRIFLVSEHDGRIVADAVADWSTRHGRPFTLELTGPAGGRVSAGRGGAGLRMDAVEFWRTLSGRATGPGMLQTPVPF